MNLKLYRKVVNTADYPEVTINPCASKSTHFFAHPNLTEQVNYFVVSIEKCSGKFHLVDSQVSRSNKKFTFVSKTKLK